MWRIVMILKIVFKFHCNKSNWLLNLRRYTNTAKHWRIMASKKKSSKNKKAENEAPEEKLTIESIKSFAYSPRKTRNHIKIEYDDCKKSNACTSSFKVQDDDEIVNKKSKRNTSKKSNKKVDSADVQLANDAEQNFKRKSPSKDKEQIIQDGNDKQMNKNLKWEPQNWRKVLENLKTMRSLSLAPVDTMGCDRCSDENADEKTKRFHILVSLMLSSQTKDQVTFEAMNRLKSKGLTPKEIFEMDSSTLEQLLNPVSFYKNKTKYLQKTSQILIEKYDSDIPKTVEELMKLPGVGPKMAHICMNSAWDIVTGIGVDVHVHRISNRLGWVKKVTKTPEDTRRELESWLPYEHWNEVNHLMVGFGQTICTPLNPKCDTCSNKDICPSSSTYISKKASRNIFLLNWLEYLVHKLKLKMVSKSEISKIKQSNGEIIMNVLRQIGQPVTMRELVDHVIESQKVDPEYIKRAVIYVLKRGVKYGFVKRVGQNRFTISFANPMGRNVADAKNEANKSIRHKRVLPKTRKFQKKSMKMKMKRRRN